MKKPSWPTDPVSEYASRFDLERFVDAIAVLAKAERICYIEEPNMPLEFDEELRIMNPADLSHGFFQPTGDHYKMTKEFISQLKAQIADIDIVAQILVYDDQILVDASGAPCHPFYVSRQVSKKALEEMSRCLGREPQLTSDVYGK